ncbi:hypothetical protein CR513_52182, partial [Mucuna pruriens]
MVTMFIDILPSPFYDKVVGSVASNFADLVTVKERIESSIKRGKFAQANTGSNFTRKTSQGKSSCNAQIILSKLGASTPTDSLGQPQVETTNTSNAPSNRPNGRSRVFAPIPMTYMSLFPFILQNNIVAILSLKPLEPPYPKSYDLNGFKHKVQDLIVGGWLKFKENEPNVNSNPLPAHGGQSINALIHEPLDLEFNERNLAHSVLVVVLGQDGDYPPEPFIIRYDPVRQSLTPLIIQVPTRPAYKDNHVVPWQYGFMTETSSDQPSEGSPSREVTNIERKARSLRRPTPQKTPQRGKEAEEFLKLIQHSEYELLEQMNKTPAQSHRSLPLKILNEAHVAQDITVEKFGGIINNITSRERITFLEDEVPTKGRRNNQPFHISVKCGDYMIARVLIDNGSSLNVLPKSTLDKLCSLGF